MRAARFLAILVLFVAIIAAILYLFRLPIAGWAIRSAMANAGLENPQARVAALTLDGVRLEKVAAGPNGREAFFLEAIEADYHWRELLMSRKVDAVRAGPGGVRLTITDDGKVSLPGFSAGGASGSGSGLPFSSVSVNDLAVSVDAPDGAASGALNADFDMANGGNVVAVLTTSGVAWKGVRIAQGEANIDANLSADGQIVLTAGFNGDVEAYGASAAGATLRIEGDGASWRDLVSGAASQLAGRGHIEFNAPKILFASETLPETMSLAPVEAAFGDQISEAALSGAFDVEFSDAGLEVRLPENTILALSTPDGAGLALSASGGAPIFKLEDGRETSSFAFNLESDGVNASGAVDAEQQGEILRVAAPIRIEEYTSPDFAIAGSTIEFSALVEGDALAADLAVRSGLNKLRIGRLTVSDAPFTSAFRIDADLEAKTANVYNKEECVTFERARGRLAEQNSEAALGRTQFCNEEGPLAVLAWSGDMVCSLGGEILSADGRFRMGETRAIGRPPNIRFTATYFPAENRTHVEGGLSSGAMTINDTINLSAVLGRFDFMLNKEMMQANGVVDRVRVAQNLETLLIAPVIATGRVKLDGLDTTFDYELTTTSGDPLGTGDGSHDMATASGETVFTFDGLRFAPGGLQPNELALGLKGIISAAKGGVDGSVRFGWSPEGVTSGADIHLHDVSFGGPTLAVTRTSGVNGDIAFSNLFPVKTDGVQSVTVRTVDLSALQLEAGEISFELPGDDTLYLQRGEFPWFGGTIGANGATASFSGKATIPLQAKNVDLKQVFEYVDINGLSGEGIVAGALPLVFEDGKARIENGVLHSVGPGVLRYQGVASDQAAETGQGAKVAFDILRDLQYKSMLVAVSGPLDGRLNFVVELEGTGEVTVRDQAMIRRGSGRVPVIYRITLDAALLELLRQAKLSQDVSLQIIQGLEVVE